MSIAEILQAAIERSARIQEDHREKMKEGLDKVYSQLAKTPAELRLKSIRRMLGDEKDDA